ncbi:MAG: 3-dehydroquinate synthase [Actinomycetes bacterium]|jgi:3-dehydroquinate synthase|nr:3-dehydroquinate synthase [Actinomycetes bacterium]
MAVCSRRDFADGVRLDIDLGLELGLELGLPGRGGVGGVGGVSGNASVDGGAGRYPLFLVSEPAKLLARLLSSAAPAFTPASLLGQQGEDAGSERVQSRTVVVICDENTAERFGVATETGFIAGGCAVEALTVPAGEEMKTWAVAGQLLEALADLKVDRDAVICSLGGGMVSDLAGFVAASYLRGVAFVQIPTTLLALVDAAIGGKTAVNLPAGKNLAGAWLQPLAIAADIAALDSLPDAEYRSGLAEAAKNAVLSGEELLRWTEEHAAALVARDREALRELIVRNVAFKAGVIASDPWDCGARTSLNYGHTLGHALERTRGYEGLTHGAAVAEGMRFAARLAVQLVGADLDFVRRQDALLDALGLPASADVSASPLTDIVDAMRVDKKSRGHQIRMVLVSEPGTAQLVSVNDSLLYENLRAWVGVSGEAACGEAACGEAAT